MGCFVSSWDLTGSVTTTTQSSICDQSITTFTVPSGGQIEETYPWGQVKGDSYLMTANFTYKSQSAFAKFQVK
jgi:hypothetical protein